MKNRENNAIYKSVTIEDIELFIKSELVKNELNPLDLQYQAIKEQKYNELLRENKQLKENWNKLKEYTREKYDIPSWASCGARYVLEKMQELEKSDSNEN